MYQQATLWDWSHEHVAVKTAVPNCEQVDKGKLMLQASRAPPFDCHLLDAGAVKQKKKPKNPVNFLDIQSVA